jgi:hypothetical protein
MYNELSYEAFSKETGERIADNEMLTEAEKIIQEEKRKLFSNLYEKYKNNKWDMTLEELELYRKIKKLDTKVRFNPGGFCFVADNEISEDLNIETRGLLYLITSNYLTYEGYIIQKNKKSMTKLTDLKVLDEKISKYTWENKISKDIKQHNIIVRNKIRGEWRLIMNPFFNNKGTEITEHKFITFYKEIKNVISEDDYLYLCKKFNIIP